MSTHSAPVTSPFDWCQYLVLARELNGEDKIADKEAKLRSSISRAYYAAFCKARNYLINVEHDPVVTDCERRYDCNIHSRVINAFKNDYDGSRQQIGKDLFDLRTDRNKADYENKIRNLEGLAKISADSAEEIISQIDSFEDSYS